MCTQGQPRLLGQHVAYDPVPICSGLFAGAPIFVFYGDLIKGYDENSDLTLA